LVFSYWVNAPCFSTADCGEYREAAGRHLRPVSAAHDMIGVMARRRNTTPRFDMEDEILAAPIASISDIATKLEIITARAELFDVSDDLERLHDQIAAFRAGESLAPEPWNWHAT
jgi:hypothetical protein